MKYGFKSLPERLRQRISAGVFFFLQGLVFSSWASRIPYIKDSLSLDDSQLGFALLAIPLGQFIAMGPSGVINSKFGSKNVIKFSTLLYPVTLILISCVTSLWQLMAVLVFYGIFANLQSISINTQAVGVERVYGRSIMASLHGLWSLAGFTGGLVTSILVPYGIMPFQQFVGVFVFAIIVLIVFWPHLLDSQDDIAAPREGKKKSFMRPDSLIILIGFIAFSCWCAEGCMFDWSGVYFETVVKPGKDLVAMGFVSFMCTMSIGRFIADYFINRFGVIKVIGISGVMIAAGLSFSVAFPTFVPAMLGFALAGFGVSSVIPLCYSIAGRSKTMPPSLAIAAVSSIGFFGFLIAPPLIGLIAHHSSLRVSFMMIACVGAMLTVLSFKVGKLLEKNKE